MMNNRIFAVEMLTFFFQRPLRDPRTVFFIFIGKVGQGQAADVELEQPAFEIFPSKNSNAALAREPVSSRIYSTRIDFCIITC